MISKNLKDNLQL